MGNPLSVAPRLVYQAILVEMTDKSLYGLHATQCHKEIRGIFNGGIWPYLWSQWQGKMFPALRAHAQPTIIRIWQEVHICSDASKSICMMMYSNANISALLDLCVGNSPITGESPSQRPVTRSFEASFDLRLSTRLSKQSRRRWFETPSRSLWRHSNVWILAMVTCTWEKWYLNVLNIEIVTDDIHSRWYENVKLQRQFDIYDRWTRYM